MIDLKKYLINEDKPNGNNQSEWSAGDQLEALRFYLDSKIEILKEHKEDDYQGNCFALMKVDDTLILWRDSFGSCSGCDSLDGENGYEYIKFTLSEGNTKQFKSFSEAREWFNNINEGEKWFWEEMPSNILYDNTEELK